MNYKQLTASQWYSIINNGDVVDQGTRQAFDAWLAEDVDHQLEYLECEITSDALEVLQYEPEIKEIVEATVSSIAPKQRFRWFVNWKPFAPVLASFCVAVFVSLIMFNKQLSSPDNSLSYITKRGEQQTIQLNDGSEVNLNTNSQLKVTYEPNRRYLQLHQGEAVFSVKHDADRPFDVVAGNRIIRAVGTRFNVWVEDGRVSVSVLEGKVKILTNLSKQQEEKAIGAGFMAKFDSMNTHSSAMSQLSDLQRINAWLEGKLEFDNTPLELALAEYNRYSDTKIRVKEHSLKDIKVVGVFNIDDRESLVKALETVFPIKVVYTATDIELYAK